MKRILFGVTIMLAGLFLATPAWATHNSLNFDGINDFVSVPNNSKLGMTNQITIETWVYPTNLSEQKIILHRTNGNPGGYFLSLWPGLRLLWGKPYYANGYFDVECYTAVSLNTWTHVAVTYDGSIVNIYYNGILKLAQTVGSVSLDPADISLYIGSYSGGSMFFRGNMDRLRIWNVARTQEEIEANMNGTVAPGTTGLVAQFTFNQGLADGDNEFLTTLYDSSGAYPVKGSPIDGTLTNFELEGSTSNWVISAAPSAVELCSFTAVSQPGQVEIAWSTASESNSASWMVERSNAFDDGYVTLGRLPAAGNASSVSRYSFVDDQAEAGVTYYYKIAEQELDGKVTYYGPVSASAGISLGSYQNQVSISPNPCKQFATISYQLSQPGMVSAKIYNMLGQHVSTVFSGSRQAGAYSLRWDGKNARGQAVPAGVYMLRLSAGEQTFTKRIALIK